MRDDPIVLIPTTEGLEGLAVVVGPPLGTQDGRVPADLPLKRPPADDPGDTEQALKGLAIGLEETGGAHQREGIPASGFAQQRKRRDQRMRHVLPLNAETPEPRAPGVPIQRVGPLYGL